MPLLEKKFEVEGEFFFWEFNERINKEFARKVLDLIFGNNLFQFAPSKLSFMKISKNFNFCNPLSKKFWKEIIRTLLKFGGNSSIFLSNKEFELDRFLENHTIQSFEKFYFQNHHRKHQNLSPYLNNLDTNQLHAG